MRTIDVETWPRRHHFQLFRGFDHPHFNMTANVDVTALHAYVKRNGFSLTVAMVYVITRAANAVPEFRLRIRGEQVVEHDVVHPGFSFLVTDDLFGFCDVEYTEVFSEFAVRASAAMAELKEAPNPLREPERDDVLYMSPIPWVSFTSFGHPMQLHPADSVPRFAWGKFTAVGNRLEMPVSAQGHHALMDGIHMARFYARVEEYVSDPQSALGRRDGP